MSSINKHTGDNYGGIAKLSYALMSAVQSEVNTTKSTITIAHATLDAHFYNIAYHHFQAQLRQQRANSEQGPAWDIQLGLDIIGDRQEIRDQIELVSDRKLWIYLTTHNGDQLFIGHQDEGLTQSESLDTGKMLPDIAGYEYAFTGLLTQKIRPVTITA